MCVSGRGYLLASTLADELTSTYGRLLRVPKVKNANYKVRTCIT